MTTVTPPDQAGADAAPKTSSIPAQRAAQSLRLLVLGKGEDATAVRERATAAGVELAQRFSTRVTHVVVDSSVGDDDARLTRARTAGLPIIGADAAGDLLAGVVPEPRGEALDTPQVEVGTASAAGIAEAAGTVEAAEAAEAQEQEAAEAARRVADGGVAGAAGADADADADAERGSGGNGGNGVDAAVEGVERAEGTVRIEAVQRTETREIGGIADASRDTDFADAAKVADEDVVDVAELEGSREAAAFDSSVADTAADEDAELGVSMRENATAEDSGSLEREAGRDGDGDGEKDTDGERDEAESASAFTGSPLEAELFFPPLADDEPDLMTSLTTSVEAEPNDLEASLPYEESRWGRRRGRRGRDRAPAMPVDSLGANTPTSMTTASPAAAGETDADTDMDTDSTVDASVSADTNVERFTLAGTATSSIGSADERDDASIAATAATATTSAAEGESTDRGDAAGTEEASASTSPSTSDTADGARSAAVTVGSFAWALVPLVSVGLLTPVSIGYAAVRTRSRSLGFAAAWYTAAVAASIALSAAGRHHAAHPSAGDLSAACLAASWVGGTVQSLLVRRRVFR